MYVLKSNFRIFLINNQVNKGKSHRHDAILRVSFQLIPCWI